MNEISNLPNVERSSRKQYMYDIVNDIVNKELNSDSRCNEDLDRVAKEIQSLGKRYYILFLEVIEEMCKSGSPRSEMLKRIHTQFVSETLSVKGKDTGIKYEEMEELIRKLTGCGNWIKRLNIEFDTKDLYVYGISIIAAWASKKMEATKFSSSIPRSQDFLNRIGLIEAIHSSESDPVKFDTESILGITRIAPNPNFDTDLHASRLMQLFKSNLSEIDDKSMKALSLCFAELIENVCKHSKSKSPGFLFANYHKNHKIMHVCIVDTGIGIQKSFDESDIKNEDIHNAYSIKWVEKATELFVTSKKKTHSGYGLYIAKELIRKNSGHFSILSGKNVHYIDFHGRQETIQLEQYWKGTIVALQFRLDRPMDIMEVYKSFPDNKDFDMDVFT